MVQLRLPGVRFAYSHPPPGGFSHEVPSDSRASNQIALGKQYETI